MAERRTAQKTAVVSAGETTFIEFKVHGLGTIEGSVENEYTDALLKGVRVTLQDQAGKRLAEDTTGDDGFYHFKNVRAGLYTVVLNLPKGYRSNDQTEKTVQVDTGANVRADFLIHRHGSIKGRVINEQTEEPLSHVDVELVDSGGNVVRTANTDEHGNYEFGELEVDRYTVRMAVPESYESSEDESEGAGSEGEESDHSFVQTGGPTTGGEEEESEAKA